MTAMRIYCESGCFEVVRTPRPSKQGHGALLWCGGVAVDCGVMEEGGSSEYIWNAYYMGKQDGPDARIEEKDGG